MMAANVARLRDHRVVLWGKHGVMARSDHSVTKAADLIEYAETAAHYEYMDLVGGRARGGADRATSCAPWSRPPSTCRRRWCERMSNAFSGGRSGRGERAGHARRLGRRAPDPARVAPLPERPGGRAGAPVLGCVAALAGDPDRARPLRGGVRDRRSRGSASTPGRWIIALLDGQGRLLGNPYHYRDRPHHRACRRRWTRASPPADLYARTGIQRLPINTLYQLASHARRAGPAIGRGANAAADPRPVRLLADRARGGRVHQRHDDAASTTRARGGWATERAARAGSARADPAADRRARHGPGRPAARRARAGGAGARRCR